ncbi:hypothetical protein ACVWWH_000535, partial [Sinomonas sp. RB5]
MPVAVHPRAQWWVFDAGSFSAGRVCLIFLGFLVGVFFDGEFD